jgi:hypothetical protein
VPRFVSETIIQSSIPQKCGVRIVSIAVCLSIFNIQTRALATARDSLKAIRNVLQKILASGLD